MPNPLLFVGKGAALTAAARAADKANGGGGPFRRLGEGRGAALREVWPVEALHTVPAARRAAAGDADGLFAYARPPTSKAKREAGERRALQHQEWADAPKEKRQRAAEERAAAQAALLAPLVWICHITHISRRRHSVAPHPLTTTASTGYQYLSIAQPSRNRRIRPRPRATHEAK